MVVGEWERLAATVSIAPLRFSLAHGDRLSTSTIERMARLGIGLVVDGRQVYRADASEAAWGRSVLADAPPLGDLETAGVALGVGTDGTRASIANPWVALWSLCEGRSIDGRRRRDPRHLLSRVRALQIATAGNAWLTGDEDRVGRLMPGRLADFAVLDRDYFTVPADQIPSIRSMLTVSGGQVIHSAGDFAGV